MSIAPLLCSLNNTNVNMLSVIGIFFNRTHCAVGDIFDVNINNHCHFLRILRFIWEFLLSTISNRKVEQKSRIKPKKLENQQLCCSCVLKSGILQEPCQDPILPSVPCTVGSAKDHG